MKTARSHLSSAVQALVHAMLATMLGCFALSCAAQERPGWQASAAAAYASSAVVATKPRTNDSPLKNLQTPLLRTIAPDAAPSAIVLPEHRTAVDQMLQSHEFTFGRNRRASNFAGGRAPAGTAMDLDAVKLRVSRDKVMIKAEWTFN